MSNIVLKKDKKKLKVKEISKINGYKFTPKIRTKDISIKEMIVINHSLIEKIIVKKMNNNIKKLTTVVFDILTQSEPSPMLLQMAFDDIARVRAVLLDKYKKDLPELKVNTYLKKLKLLEDELRKKNFSTISRIFTQMNLMEDNEYDNKNDFIR